MPEIARLAPKAMRTLLGIDATKNGNPDASPSNVSFIHRYSTNEKNALLSKLFVRQQSLQPNIPTGSIISYLQPTHDQIGYRANQFNKMRALAPEIEQSAIIVASSILSPNDLKDGEFIFNFDRIPMVAADPKLGVALSEVYSNYFNETLQLGKDAFNWLQDILYKDGGKAILILPPAIQNKLRDRTREDVVKDQAKAYDTKVSSILSSYIPGNESFNEYMDRPEVKDNDYFFSGKPYSWKDYLDHDTYGKTKDTKEFLTEAIPAMESFGVTPPSYVSQSVRASPSEIPFGAMEAMIVNLRTKLEDGEGIRITENPEILRFRPVSNKHVDEKMRSRMAECYGVNNAINTFPEEEFVTLGVDGTEKHFGHPTLIKLPIEAVIPIIVPGTPSEHLGYFILLDENGEPLRADNAGAENPDGALSPEGSLNNASYDAIFGDNTWRALSVNNANVQDMGNAIFNRILDGYIRTRLSNIYGRSDLTIARMNSISSVLFYRLLQRKRTTVVFAYTDLLHYFAFDYHDDGTGYAKIEEIGFLISMRTSFIVANVMAMARDAVVHKKIVIGTDNANTNIEGMIDMAYNVYNAKRKFNACNVNPDDIIRDMYSDAVTIEPRNIPGLSDFSVETENVTGSNATNSNRDLVEYLSNLIASHCDVPPAALNQMAEPEYAKSLVTYNLFFAKRIMERQNVFCKQFTEFVRSYTTFDPIFQKAISTAISAHSKKDIGTEAPKEVVDLAKRDPNTYSDAGIATLTNLIIHNVMVTLPNPNIVMDKAKFSEFNDFMNMVSSISNIYFNSELIPDSDGPAKSALKTLQAKYALDMMTKYINRAGSNNLIDPPDFENIETDDVVDFIQSLQNLNSRFSRQRTAVSNFPNDSRDNSPSGNYGGSSGGDDFGGGMGF